ncbi:hypothetical protein CY35_12G100100 [Sphagnum magellanicum]|nr:hypothetical protein CY35_12G100100 [Sphagnum magellanicum]
MILTSGWKFHTGIQRKKAEDDKKKKKKKNTKKSFKPQSVKCMKPNFSFHTRHCVLICHQFGLTCINTSGSHSIFFSTECIHASIMYRVTSKVVAIANSTAKES